MTHTNAEIIERWVETMTYPGLRMYERSWNRNRRENVFAEGNVLYSYGTHFPLAVKLPWGYLLNGTTFSPTTSRHQAILRRVMSQGEDTWQRRRDPEDPFHRHCIIPFAALDASSIERDTVVLLDQLPDRTVERQRVLSDEEIKRLNLVVRNRQVGMEHMVQVYPQDQRGYVDYNAPPREELRFNPLLWMSYRLNEQDRIVQTNFVHQLGECLIKAKVRTRRRPDTWTGWRYRTAYFISAWDNQDTNTYFFSELPEECNTLDEAYEMLKPQTVKFGEFEGKRIVRQGDIFAVETDYTTRDLTKMGASPVKRMDYVHGTNHVVTEQRTLRNGAVLGRGVLWHRPEGRRADHRRQVIGKKWAVIVKNTVPTTKRKGRR